MVTGDTRTWIARAGRRKRARTVLATTMPGRPSSTPSIRIVVRRRCAARQPPRASGPIGLVIRRGRPLWGGIGDGDLRRPHAAFARQFCSVSGDEGPTASLASDFIRGQVVFIDGGYGAV